MLSGIVFSTTQEDAMSSEKIRENRLRRMAERQGLALNKSRRRDPRALGFGRWMIVDPYSNAVVLGAGPTGEPDLNLDDVELYLTEGPEAFFASGGED
jgi:hypothetical protein